MSGELPMDRRWLLDVGTRVARIIREEREKAMSIYRGDGSMKQGQIPEVQWIPLDEIGSISLLRASVGPHDTIVEVDPYYDAVNWHDAARGDGRSYGGAVETVTREEGELFEVFYARAQARADELN